MIAKEKKQAIIAEYGRTCLLYTSQCLYKKEHSMSEILSHVEAAMVR